MRSDRTYSLRLLLTALAALALSEVARAEPPDVVVPAEMLAADQVVPPNADWAGARKAAIKQLIGLAHRSGPETLGFAGAPADDNAITVLYPIADAVILVEKLAQYAPQMPAESLLLRRPRLTFPVTVGDKVKSSFTLQRADGGSWKPVAFGSSNLIRAAVQARIKAAKAPSLVFPGQKAEYTLVMVSGLNQYFLYTKGPLGAHLTPLYDSRRYNWKAGDPLAARTVLMKMVDDAKHHNGLPT